MVEGKKWWEFTERVNLLFPHKVYALVLCAWRAYVGESDKMKHKIWLKVPMHPKKGEYNWLLLSLTNTEPHYEEVKEQMKEMAKDYQPRIRNYLTAEPEDAARLPLSDPDEKFPIDKDILTFLLNR